MGSWGTLCTFDCERFRAEIVPALRAGEHPALIADEIARSQNASLWKLPPMHGLAKVMATFDDDLNASSSLERFFTAPAGWSYEQLCVLFQRLLFRYCVTAFTIVGRKYAAWMTLRSDDDVTGTTEESDALVAALDERWHWWTHSGGGYREGLNGWLDAAETVRFAHFLEQVAPADDYHDREAWLDRVGRMRYLVDRARLENVGLLWGGDLWVEHGRGPHSIPQLG